MIYLHHTSLSLILPNYQERLGNNDRECIHAYRHQLLNKFCHHKNLPIPIYDKDNHGKPFCQNIPQLQFNQSHCTSDYVLVYSLDIKNIGVDIENIHRQVNFDDLAKRCFHHDEYTLWKNHHNKKEIWFKIWTIKEAVLKASGLGIRLPLNELRAVFIDDDTGYVYHQDIGKFYFQTMMIDACMVTVAYPFDYGNIRIVGV